MNGAVVSFHAFFDQIEAQTGSGDASFYGCLGAVKAAEKIWKGFRRDADALILHLDANHIVFMERVNTDGAGKGEFDGIVY